MGIKKRKIKTERIEIIDGNMMNRERRRRKGKSRGATLFVFSFSLSFAIKKMVCVRFRFLSLSSSSIEMVIEGECYVRVRFVPFFDVSRWCVGEVGGGVERERERGRERESFEK